MVDVPYARGYLGVDYRTNLSLHRSVGTTITKAGRGDPQWDVYIGPLPFLLANKDDRPYIRESTSAKRDRFDASRDSGENSLDSSIWLRSFTSWHLGAGQSQVEPLEQSPEVARFRFDRSAGVNVWDAGKISLLRDPIARLGSARKCLGAVGKGVVTSTTTNVVLVQESGVPLTLSASPGNALALTTNRWLTIGDGAGVVRYGNLDGTGETTMPVINGATAVTTAKDRLWIGAGSKLWEILDVTATPSATPFYDFRDGTIVDIDSGAGGVYVMVAGATTTIYVITVDDSGSLNPPREVARLPRGEKGQVLYGYLSRYLAVGTSKGVRIADCSVDTSLPMGPLTIEMTGQGCVDMVADGNFLYVTTGSEGIDTLGDGTKVCPGLYRIDLSRMTMPGQQYGDTAASRYAWATDVWSGITPGSASSVTYYNGRIWFIASDYLYRNGDAPIQGGWLDTGRVTFSTSEQKTWQSVRLDATGGSGQVTVQVNSGAGLLSVAQTSLKTPFHDDLVINSWEHPPGGWMSVRVALYGLAEIEALLLRAVPAPHRTRYISLPLMAFDLQADRNNTPVGYEGFGFDRVKDLESLEKTGALVDVWDVRTDEVLSCQIEKIAFEGATPPDRGNPNWSGIVVVTLLVV